MALDGINYLVSVTQMKASAANDAAIQSQPKPTNQKATSFDTYTKAIAETFSTTLAAADSSQRLVRACARGEHFKEVIIELW